jgi:predicted dienelactone hydrolase
MAGLRRFRFSVWLSVLAVLLLASATQSVARDFGVLMETIELADGTPADVYAPAVPPGLKRKLEDRFPVAVLLQGALIDKAYYSTFARIIADNDYIVVVPNRERTIALGPNVVSGLFPDVHVVTDAVDAMIVEDDDPRSPFFRITDTSTIVLLGHSFGGAVGIDAAAGVCEFPLCDPPIPDSFVWPEGLKAAALYGTSRVLCDPDTPTSVADCVPSSRDTSGVAVALIQGTNDGIASPLKADATLPELEPPHALVQLPGATHYAICDVAQPPFPATIEPNTSELDQQVAVALVAQRTLDWLDMILAAD